MLKELGGDRIINYSTENLDKVLTSEYPKGINLVFDCVGSRVFDTCLENLAIRGRLNVVRHVVSKLRYIQFELSRIRYQVAIVERLLMCG